MNVYTKIHGNPSNNCWDMDQMTLPSMSLKSFQKQKQWHQQFHPSVSQLPNQGEQHKHNLTGVSISWWELTTHFEHWLFVLTMFEMLSDTDFSYFQHEAFVRPGYKLVKVNRCGTFMSSLGSYLRRIAHLHYILYMAFCKFFFFFKSTVCSMHNIHWY